MYLNTLTDEEQDLLRHLERLAGAVGMKVVYNDYDHAWNVWPKGAASISPRSSSFIVDDHLGFCTLSGLVHGFLKTECFFNFQRCSRDLNNPFYGMSLEEALVEADLRGL